MPDPTPAPTARLAAENARLREALLNIEQIGHNPADLASDLIGPDGWQKLALRLADMANDALAALADSPPTVAVALPAPGHSAIVTPDGAVRVVRGDAGAIISRLPVTADGVPVTPGMELWEPSWRGEANRYTGNVGMFNRKADLDRHFSRCYSTRAAAEAAHPHPAR